MIRRAVARCGLALWLGWNVVEFVALWPVIRAAWAACFKAWGLAP